MTTWNSRQLPYPLLSPWTDDYGDKTFSAVVPHAVLNNGRTISLTIKYHLTSQLLLDLVSTGKAHYVALLSCSKTSMRFAYSSTQDEDVQVLNAGDYSQSMRLRPYLVTTQSIDGFISKEHAPEFGYFRPEGFDIPSASILAVGEETRITLEEGGSPNSVIDLVDDPKIEDGRFVVELDDHHIKVYVSQNDRKRVEAIRERDKEMTGTEMVTLFPSIYLSAVTEALRNLSTYPEARWVHTMRQSLEKHNVKVDDEELRNNALFYAQTLMEKPVGTLLTALINREER